MKLKEKLASDCAAEFVDKSVSYAGNTVYVWCKILFMEGFDRAVRDVAALVESHPEIPVLELAARIRNYGDQEEP